MCAAGGKIILTLALHTILYLHPKFHEIIFQIDKIAAIWSASPNKSPLVKAKGEISPILRGMMIWPPGEIYHMKFNPEFDSKKIEYLSSVKYM